MKGIPMMLLPIPEEIQGHIQHFISTTEYLNAKEIELLERYASDNFVLRIMGFSFFEEWEPVRNFTVKAWTMKAINRLLAAHQRGDGNVNQ